MVRDECRYGAMLLLIGTLLLEGCATGSGSTAAPEGLPVGTRVALPTDAKALGEVACEFYKAGGSQGLEQFEIRCPGWERPAGLVWRGNLPRPATNWEAKFFDAGDLAKTAQTEAECGDTESTQILDGRAAVLRRCTSHNGGFPYLLIAAGADGRAFVLWGPAHLAPLFESFVHASLRGTAQEQLPGSRSQLIALAEQAIVPEGRRIGLEDMGQFTALDELSTLYNSAKNHQRALELAQRALEIHERIKGANDPSGGYLIARRPNNTPNDPGRRARQRPRVLGKAKRIPGSPTRWSASATCTSNWTSWQKPKPSTRRLSKFSTPCGAAIITGRAKPNSGWRKSTAAKDRSRKLALKPRRRSN